MAKKKAKAKRVTKRQRNKKQVKRSAKKRVVKKVAKKKVSKKRAAKKQVKKQAPEISLEKIGEVTHYFPHVKAAAIMLLKDGLRVGDNIYIKGHTTKFKEKIRSIQLDRVPIQEGRKGQEIGLLVKSRVRQGDSVYRI